MSVAEGSVVIIVAPILREGIHACVVRGMIPQKMVVDV